MFEELTAGGKVFSKTAQAKKTFLTGLFGSWRGLCVEYWPYSHVFACKHAVAPLFGMSFFSLFVSITLTFRQSGLDLSLIDSIDPGFLRFHKPTK